MKLKESVVITSVDDYFVLVDTSPNDDRFNGIIKLNKSGKTMCDFLLKDITYEQLVNEMLNVYDVEKSVIENDINNTINKLKEINLIIL